MNLLQTLMNANGPQLVGQLARNFGVDETQASAALQNLVPALAGGLKHNLARQGGLESLLGALQTGGHARYLENPALLGEADTVADGNAILGHLFGSKEVSRQVAAQAAAKTGLDTGVLKQMLPAVAAVAMGALNKQVAGAGQGGASSAMAGGGGFGGLLGGLLGGAAGGLAGAGAGGVLAGLLDQDGDGSIVDDVLGMLLKR